jgi:hypothetical protein
VPCPASGIIPDATVGAVRLIPSAVEGFTALPLSIRWRGVRGEAVGANLCVRPSPSRPGKGTQGLGFAVTSTRRGEVTSPGGNAGKPRPYIFQFLFLIVGAIHELVVSEAESIALPLHPVERDKG